MLTTPEKVELHTRFWQGKGPCLILIPTSQIPQYDTEGYAELFEHPLRMWHSEMHRARPVVGWPTDGIPTVRPNLGVVFIPGIAGQAYTVRDDAMPWPGKPLSRKAIRDLPAIALRETKMMQLALEFYAVHQANGEPGIVPYHPDTQGIFSLAHLLYGNTTFLEVLDDPAWIHELLGIILDLNYRVVKFLKSSLGEEEHSMTHGHGTSQGVYFPHVGVRMSEDTATLLSPELLDEFVVPYLERAISPFGGGFVHYCGRHPHLFEQLCRMEGVRAIDLGNPEMYDTRWLLERCAETNTILFSPVAALDSEGWDSYVRRLANLARETGARLILRPTVFPDNRDDCARMLELWHELTS